MNNVCFLLLLVVFGLSSNAQVRPTFTLETSRIESFKEPLGAILNTHHSSVSKRGIHYDSVDVVVFVLPRVTEADGIDSSTFNKLYKDMASLDTIVQAGLYVRVLSLPRSDNHLFMYLRNSKGKVWVTHQASERYWIVSPFQLYPFKLVEKLTIPNLEFRDFVEADILGRTEYYLYSNRIVEICDEIEFR